MTTNYYRFRLAVIPAAAAISPSLKSGLGLHFEAWPNSPIFKDVGAVNAGDFSGIYSTCTATGITADGQLNYGDYSDTTKTVVNSECGRRKSRSFTCSVN